MTRYSIEPKERIFVKGYGFLGFAKSMGKNIGKNISKYLSKTCKTICYRSTWNYFKKSNSKNGGNYWWFDW